MSLCSFITLLSCGILPLSCDILPLSCDVYPLPCHMKGKPSRVLYRPSHQALDVLSDSKNMIIVLHDKQFTSHETSRYCFDQKSMRNLKEQINVISKIENPTPWCTGGSSEDLGFALTSNHSTTEGATSNSQGV